ncbi:MAG: glutathione peroxidase [Ferruginibacter sp.]|nr:glutathione peroxidase [Ferruginibacter sp.]
MKILILATCFALFAQPPNFYTLPLNLNAGNVKSMLNFKGKKILIVNTAVNSRFAPQMADLKMLQEANKTNLVIIFCPSNSFKHEPMFDTEIKKYLFQKKQISNCTIAAKADVVGVTASPLYKWLTTKALNGVANFKVKDDFHKFLINEKGDIIGSFTSVVNPLDSIIQNAIKLKTKIVF